MSLIPVQPLVNAQEVDGKLEVVVFVEELVVVVEVDHRQQLHYLDVQLLLQCHLGQVILHPIGPRKVKKCTVQYIHFLINLRKFNLPHEEKIAELLHDPSGQEEL